MRFWKRISCDTSGLLTVGRTASALLLGNTFVVPILTNGFPRMWWLMPLFGLLGIIGTNFKLKGESHD